MTAQLVIKYVRDLDAYVQAQRDAGTDTLDTMRRQAITVATQIANINTLSVPEATELSQVIHNSSFSQDDKHALIKKVDGHAASACGAKTDSRGQQNCDGFLFMLTAQDWEYIKSASRTGKINAVATRANAWGIGCPSEKLCGMMAIQIAVHGFSNDSPSVADLHDLKIDIHHKIKALDIASRAPFAHRNRYPRDPKELPLEVINFAFKGEAIVNPPDGLVDAYNRISAGPKFLRNHRTSRSGSPPAAAARQPDAFPNASQMQGTPWEQWNQFQQMMQFMRTHQGSPGSPPASSHDGCLLTFPELRQAQVGSPPSMGATPYQKTLGSWKPRTAQMLTDGGAHNAPEPSDDPSSASDGPLGALKVAMEANLLACADAKAVKKADAKDETAAKAKPAAKAKTKAAKLKARLAAEKVSRKMNNTQAFFFSYRSILTASAPAHLCAVIVTRSICYSNSSARWWWSACKSICADRVLRVLAFSLVEPCTVWFASRCSL